MRSAAASSSPVAGRSHQRSSASTPRSMMPRSVQCTTCTGLAPACGKFTLESGGTMAESLAGKTALVTGGARRLGAAIARRLHAAGADLLIHYRDSEAEASALIAELNAIRAKSAANVKAEL